MTRVIVVGTGAGGATVARELAGTHAVTLVEAGNAFAPFRGNLEALAKVRATGLFFDERIIRLLFPAMRVRRVRDAGDGSGVVLVNGVCLGGTTTLSAGNAVRCDEDLRAAGIDLDAEFAELARDIPISDDHEDRWTPTTRRLADACLELGLEPTPIPKLGDYRRCTRCGRCVLGCPSGAKWDARRFIADAVGRGASIETGLTVDRLVWSRGRASGVRARRGLRTLTLPADVVVLAAGGIDTPAILERSGIPCESRLFVDPVLCVAAPMPGAGLDREVSMPFAVQRDRYLISPYMDWVSFFFDRRWRLPAGDIVSLMIKLADDDHGRAGARHLEKSLTGQDRERLADGVSLCTEILERIGVPRATHVLGTLTAGHPGGALPAGASPDPLHDARLPENVWVADASLIPKAPGRPPMLTIMAMAKRVARLIARRAG